VLPVLDGFVTVAGSVNVDIAGTPAAPLVQRDSNPGRVRFSIGGVGWNIAANLALLGMPVQLITVLGDDAYAERIRQLGRSWGVGLDWVLTAPGQSTSSYLCINDEQGDMAVAVNDMAIYDRLTPVSLADKMPAINSGRLLVIDANLSEAAIVFLAGQSVAPVLAEPVSTLKAPRLRPVLDKLHLMKPNRLEAETLSGIKINGDPDLARAADRLLAQGVRQLFISLGSQGAYVADARIRQQLPVFPCRRVNSTGCGDAFMAACAWGTALGLDPLTVARAGLAAAAICMESINAVNPQLSSDRIRQMIGI
jgi:pseudouridine kinase